jgi:two-component system response regulator PilR (NtrC family)
MREIMEMILRNEGHQTDLANNGQTGLDMALKGDYDLIISDIRMPGLNGLELLRKFRESGRQTTLILISAYASAETAVEAMRFGAYDFIPKPFRNQDLLTAVHSALIHKNVDQERQALVDNVKNNQRFGSLVGSSPAMMQVYDLVKRAAQTSTSILITGESGTGKEMVAKAVHANSTRADKNFVAINCGGMPEQLVDSELFGYKKGSFTGAMADKQGLVALADGGTLFLDELAELTLPMQVKLLRFVQEKTFRPVGGGTELTADVRFIAATNKNLETEIMAGRFREDLYYRLNVINIQLPPLRERPMDIPLLAHFFLEKYSRQQKKDVRKLSTFALDILSRYHFPGNVRELENIIERSVALEQSNIILPESLRLADFKRESININSSLPGSGSFPVNPFFSAAPAELSPSPVFSGGPNLPADSATSFGEAIDLPESLTSPASNQVFPNSRLRPGDSEPFFSGLPRYDSSAPIFPGGQGLPANPPSAHNAKNTDSYPKEEITERPQELATEGKKTKGEPAGDTPASGTTAAEVPKNPRETAKRGAKSKAQKTENQAKTEKSPEPQESPDHKAPEQAEALKAPENTSQAEAFDVIPPGGLDNILAEVEGYYMFNALLSAEGRKGQAAKFLDLSPFRFRVRLIALGLSNRNPAEITDLPQNHYPKPPLPADLIPDWTGQHLNLVEVLHQVERHYIRQALKQADSKTDAAALLGLSLRSLKHRVERTNYEKEMAKQAILEGRSPK